MKTPSEGAEVMISKQVFSTVHHCTIREILTVGRDLEVLHHAAMRVAQRCTQAVNLARAVAFAHVVR